MESLVNNEIQTLGFASLPCEQGVVAKNKTKKKSGFANF